MATELPHASARRATPRPAPHPGHTLARLARQIELAVASVELTLPQYRVLAILGDGCAAASALAEKLAVSRPSVTGVVDGLVARGLVRRAPIAGDRRRIDIGLTDAGALVLAAADAAVEQRGERIGQLLAELRR
ncbi:MAG: MarR family transcriptional regulator [Acidobacteriota bacterium]|nr:MarR family transcriptional regulator [Acidobacteriota bacterium]